ncbi:MAG TPA: hypothetical protein VMS31_17360 [Pyrinomonadaceae bacterium]|nr:hypothetical protein [Pyrinomonadaceae bacterium]
MKFRTRRLFLAFFLCSLTLSVLAQKPDKPFQKWSKDESIKLLGHSPWAQTYQSQEGIAAASRDQAGREQADFGRQRSTAPGTAGSARTSTPIPVVVRLHSALPVRQALVRLRQLSANYDKMSENERGDFDKSTEGFLKCSICQSHYVVTLTRFVDSSGQTIEEGVFQRMTLDQLKGNVWLLNDKGEKRELVQFNPPKGVTDMAVLYFARQDEKGKPFLTPESKKFELGFNSAFLGTGNPYGAWLPIRFEFGVSKLLVDNQLTF